MTGKVLDNRGASGALALILPIALAIVLLLKFWLLLLLLIVLSSAWKMWKAYEWRQWCAQVNPFFSELIRDNQGCLTPLDLSLKGNLTARAAKQFLDKKAEEYGAQRKVYDDRGTMYYFLTASALGRIFDESEPLIEAESEELAGEATEKTPELTVAALETEVEVEGELVPPFAAGEEPQATSGTLIEKVFAEEQPQGSLTLGLSQADLAKRLDLHSSTIGKRKLEPDFPQWSQSRDPEGIAWKYLPETKMFVAVPKGGVESMSLI